jgi:DNA-binding NarL/FixJ family response regulator
MPRSPLIRVAVLDPHPAVRAGIEAVLATQPDLTPAGSAADAQELWPLLNRSRPDVLLLDQRARCGEGLVLCRRVKAPLLAPRVVLCAAHAHADLIVPATLAGADALVDKSADLRELLAAIRAVAAGRRTLPRITPRLQARAAARLGPVDRAVFAMRLAGTSPRDIATTVGLGGHELDARLSAILAALAGEEPVAAPPGHEAGSDPLTHALGGAA